MPHVPITVNRKKPSLFQTAAPEESNSAGIQFFGDLVKYRGNPGLPAIANLRSISG